MHASPVPKELHQKIFELTLALYRVTDFFPQGEVLRKHLREKANEVLSRIAEYGFSQERERDATAIVARVEAIKGYLKLARSMRWVKPVNLTVLEREYDGVHRSFTQELETLEKKKRHEAEEELRTWEDFIVPLPSETVLERKEPSVLHKVDKKDLPLELASRDKPNGGLAQISHDINERQKKILDYIRGASQAKVSDFFPFFGDISSKTIQRDLQDLVSRDILKKEGEKRWTVYTLNGVR